jgi:hypothetical protein
MPGLLDILGGNFGTDDPRQAAYLALASGLLAGRGNFGQVAGQAAMGAQEAFQNSRKMQMQSQLQQAQMEKMQAEAEYRKHLASKGINPDDPKDIQSARLFMAMTPEQQRQALTWRRGDMDLKEIEGVLNRVSKSGLGSTTPLTTLDREAGAQATIAGAKQTAQEQVKAAYDLVTGGVVGGGRDTQPVPQTRAQVLAGMNGGVSAQPSAPQDTLSKIRDAMTRFGDTSANVELPGFKGTIQSSQSSPVRMGLTPREISTNKNIESAVDEANKNWFKTSLEPVAAAGETAVQRVEQAKIARNALSNSNLGGWGTDAKVGAGRILEGLGMAPEIVKQYVTDAIIFRQVAMERLWTTLNAAKGMQTEGDADRARQTFAQLANTPKANEFILDLFEANAERDKLRARFYTNAKTIAAQRGDMSEVDKAWNEKMPSVFDMPSMKRWKQ